MKTVEEIKEEIKKHKKFICKIDRKDVFADIMEADSLSWIKALEWVLDEEQEWYKYLTDANTIKETRT